MISFVVIEFNSLSDVLECVASIGKSCQNINYEVIISSNSEYSGEKQKELTSMFTDFKWLFNPYNGGFAYGMNYGLKESSGEFIVVLNPDVRIKNNGMQGAIEYLKKNDDTGILGPRIVDADNILQDTCRPFMSLRQFVSRIPQRILRKKDVLLENTFDYQKLQPVDWVIGSFMILKREALNIVGGFDEGYFLYVEDMDWCKRFWDKKYKVVYYPNLEVVYKGDRKSTSSVTNKKYFNKYIYYHLKSYMRFLFKFGLSPTR